MFQAPAEAPNKQRLSFEPSVRMTGVKTAVPTTSYSQKEILATILAQPSLKKSTQALYRRVLAHPSIKTRHFALDSLSEAFDFDLDQINRRFERTGTQLGTEALSKALLEAKLRPIDLDCLVVATCTGYLCPGFASRLVESVALNPRIHYVDLVGMGCGGALPALEQASNYVRANPGSSAAVVCIEICSAAFLLDDHPEIIISNALFSDGAAAVIVTSHRERPQGDTPTPVIKDFESLTVPAWREELRFRSEKGRLRNVLGIDVPRHAGESLRNLTARLLRSNGLRDADIGHWMIHPGGHLVLKEVTRALDLQSEQMEVPRSVLENHGNMSSASVLFVLEETLRRQKVKIGEWGVLASFGAGFSAFAALVEFQ